MGRFETSAAFYHFREPYSLEFFETVAKRLNLTRRTRMLDVACGPGNLAIGFAPYTGTSTAVDHEPEMLRFARMNAAEAGTDVRFIEAGIEDLNAETGSFDFVTIGRALHWLPNAATLAVLERVIAPDGHIAICGSTQTDSPVNAWAKKYGELRRACGNDPNESRYHVDKDQWFAPFRFKRFDEVRVEHQQRVAIEDLIGRALSFSTTSPAAVGDRRPQFEAELRESLGPFTADGVVEEELVSIATLFG